MKNNMGRRVKLTESFLNKMINETIEEVLSEEHVDNDVNDKWEKAQEIIGAENVLSYLYTFLDSDTINEFIEELERVYELPLSEEDDLEDEDYDDEY